MIYSQINLGFFEIHIYICKLGFSGQITLNVWVLMSSSGFNLDNQKSQCSPLQDVGNHEQQHYSGSICLPSGGCANEQWQGYRKNSWCEWEPYSQQVFLWLCLTCKKIILVTFPIIIHLSGTLLCRENMDTLVTFVNLFIPFILSHLLGRSPRC